MSTDLHIRHQLPRLRIPPVKVEFPSDDDHDLPTMAKTEPKQDNNGSDSDGATAASAAVVIEEESYKTPTSKESRIPEILTCPPAPRKPKQAVSCKRKLLEEFQFFEVNNKEDMDAFFRSTFPKRSCPCT